MIFDFCDECHAILQEDGSGHFAYCAIVQAKVRELAHILNEIQETTVTVPTQEDFWSTMTVTAVERLRAPKVAPVPPSIVKMAQMSYEGIVNPDDPAGEKLHVLRYTFDTMERAATFAKHMKKAGNFTTPSTSVSVVVDPDALNTEQGRKVYREETGVTLSDAELVDLGGRTIAWRTGVRRGKK